MSIRLAALLIARWTNLDPAVIIERYALLFLAVCCKLSTREKQVVLSEVKLAVAWVRCEVWKSMHVARGRGGGWRVCKEILCSVLVSNNQNSLR